MLPASLPKTPQRTASGQQKKRHGSGNLFAARGSIGATFMSQTSDARRLPPPDATESTPPEGERARVARLVRPLAVDRPGVTSPSGHAGNRDRPRLTQEAEAVVPTRHGPMRMVVFRWGEERDHVALVCGDPRGDDVLVRMHSECMTSEVFGSLKCDCAEQLEHAMGLVAAEGRGVVVYLRQEGRGIGLANKIRAYALQAKGADTVDANRALGLPDDARRYDAAAAILRSLGVRSVRLLTNNPAKLDGLAGLGIPVSARVPIVVRAHPWAEGYLRTKAQRMNHRLERAEEKKG
jgi:GTP cyclohydrolase II